MRVALGLGDLDLITTSSSTQYNSPPPPPPLLLFSSSSSSSSSSLGYNVQSCPASMETPLRSLLAEAAASEIVCDRRRILNQQARRLQSRPACGSERWEGR